MVFILYKRATRCSEIENNDRNSKGLQPVAQFDERVINHIKQIPWGHNQG